MLTKIDEFIFTKLDKIVDKYCSITGKDNVSLSIGLLYIFYVLVCMGTIAESIMNTADNWDYFGPVIWGWISYDERKRYLVVRKEVKQAADSGTISNQLFEEISHFISLRKLYVAFFMVLFPAAVIQSSNPENLSNFFFYPGFIFMMASLYTICAINPGGKESAWQRLKKKVKEKIANLKPMLTPQPLPTPIRSYTRSSY